MKNSSNNNKRNGKRNNRQMIVRPRLNPLDSALRLTPEYKGQPVTVLKINADPLLITTTVGAGYSSTTSLAAGRMTSFSTRFQAFTEYRIIKVKATAQNFSSNNSGIANMWFTEDDNTSPSATSALDAKALQYNYASTEKPLTLSYVPRDPAQQTWNVVSTASGLGTPIIGFFKHYTNITNFGCPSAATSLGSVTFVYTVQFRGLI